MRDRFFVFLVGATVLCGATGAVVLFRGDDIGARLVDRAQAVPIASPELSAAAPGIVEPLSDERVLAATAIGSIVYVGANEGDHVKAGQILAEIDNATLKAQFAAAKAQITIRKNEMARLQNGAREEEKRAAAAATSEADVAVRLAKSMFTRRSSLAVSGVSSQLSLDQARAELDMAQAREELAVERERLIDAPPRPEDLAIAAGNLAQAQADADALAAAIETTRLRSPIDGVLLRRYRSVGDTVSSQPPTLIAIVGDLSQLRVRAYVDETDVARVAVGQHVEVTADAYRGREFSGRVSSVGVRVGAKRVRTDAATEKMDTETLEVLIGLDKSVRLPVGLRVDVLFEPPSETPVSQKDSAVGPS